MIEVLTVCTGNICRSPLAQALLSSRLDPREVNVHSAGSRALVGRPMTPESLALVDLHAAVGSFEVRAARTHRAQQLTESQVGRADLVLALAREHRTAAVEFAPFQLRATFTVREFARLAAAVPAHAWASVVEVSESPKTRLREALQLVASMRGSVDPPDAPEDDDVVDPYRQPSETYSLTAEQLVPALEQVVRVVSLVTTGGLGAGADGQP